MYLPPVGLYLLFVVSYLQRVMCQYGINLSMSYLGFSGTRPKSGTFQLTDGKEGAPYTAIPLHEKSNRPLLLKRTGVNAVQAARCLALGPAQE